MNARFCALALATAAASAPAADDSLDRLHADYLARRDALVAPLREAYAAKLKGLAETLNRRGDRQKAAEVEAELATLEQPAPSPPTPAPATGKKDDPGNSAKKDAPKPGSLKGSTAVLTGAAKYSEDKQGVVVSEKGATITWKLPLMHLGRQSGRIEVGCAVGNAARFELRFGQQPPIVWTMMPTGDNGGSVSASLGEFDFTSAPDAVSITVTDLIVKNKDHASVLIGALKFEPVSDAAPAETEGDAAKK